VLRTVVVHPLLHLAEDVLVLLDASPEAAVLLLQPAVGILGLSCSVEANLQLSRSTNRSFYGL
jgi:hypothetical protein